jgi:hypothetical protein
VVYHHPISPSSNHLPFLSYIPNVSRR